MLTELIRQVAGDDDHAVLRIQLDGTAARLALERGHTGEGLAMLEAAFRAALESPSLGPVHARTRAMGGALVAQHVALGREDDAERVRTALGP